MIFICYYYYYSQYLNHTQPTHHHYLHVHVVIQVRPKLYSFAINKMQLGSIECLSIVLI